MLHFKIVSYGMNHWSNHTLGLIVLFSPTFSPILGLSAFPFQPFLKAVNNISLWFQFIFPSLMTNEVAHLFMCLLTVLTSPLLKYSVLWQFYFLSFYSAVSSFYDLDIVTLLARCIANISAHSVSCLFIFCTMSYDE